MNCKIIALLLGIGLVSFATAEPGIDAPVPIRTVAPSYPEQLKEAGVSGLVVVRIVIDEHGNVTEPTIEKSTNTAFNQPAIEAISKWRFKPAMQGGKATSSKVALPIKFNAES